MFVVGTEFGLEDFWRHGKSAVTISLTGIVAPMILGSLWLFGLIARRILLRGFLAGCFDALYGDSHRNHGVPDARSDY